MTVIHYKTFWKHIDVNSVKMIYTRKKGRPSVTSQLEYRTSQGHLMKSAGLAFPVDQSASESTYGVERSKSDQECKYTEEDPLCHIDCVACIIIIVLNMSLKLIRSSSTYNQFYQKCKYQNSILLSVHDQRKKADDKKIMHHNFFQNQCFSNLQQ